MIDLLYHVTIYYEIHKFVQESEPGALTYKMVIEKAKAHERNILEYKDHQASHRGANSTPSYNNPLLSAHALTKTGPVAAVTTMVTVGASPCHDSLIFMSTHKAMGYRRPRGHFKKARPKRALHYCDY